MMIPFMVFGQQALFIPDTLSGSSLNLSLQNGEVEFFVGSMTQTIGYNQDIFGPTIILEKGNEVTINVSNNLTTNTTLHWHGLHVSSENDGGPHTIIPAGENWSPSFTVLDQAGTYWYHPHLHEKTEEQVTKGAAGFIIVKDDQELQLELPRTYGKDDFPIAIQSKAFGTDNQLLTNTALDNLILCNGILNAFLDVPAQVVRLRLLNGSTERVFNLGFQEDMMFYQIASDGGLLNNPVPLTRLRLVPGERAEVLLDLTSLQEESIELLSYGSELQNGIYGAERPSFMPFATIVEYEDNLLNGTDFKILNLNVGPPVLNPVTTIPSSLVNDEPFLERDANATRIITFRPKQMGPTSMVNGPFVMNGQSFDLDFINIEIPLNNTEVWHLVNMTAIAHPFHIHDVQFYILDINGATPPTNMQGRKDVVLVPPMGGTVRFITRFDDFADEVTPYMYHCHMLSHEDDGMMGQFIVTDQTTSTKNPADIQLPVYPNPVNDLLTVDLASPSAIQIYHSSGQLIEHRRSSNLVEKINMTDYISGVYFLNITNLKSSHIYKIVKN